MGSPYHTSGITPRLFPQDTASAEYKALSLIAELPHPQRTLLGVFVRNSVDREIASQFYLDETSGKGATSASEFLADWIHLLRRVQPVASANLDEPLKQIIWQRDGGHCCVTNDRDGKTRSNSHLFVYILPSSLFDEEIVQRGKLYKMLAAYVGERQLQSLCGFMSQSSPTGHTLSSELMLLSPQMFEHFKNGRVSFKASRLRASENSAKYTVKVNDFIPSIQVEDRFLVKLKNRTPDFASLPSAQLLEAHYQFADALAWLEVSDYMNKASVPSHNLQVRSMPGSNKQVRGKESWVQRCSQTLPRIIHYVWVRTPAFFRAFAYKSLTSLSYKMGGYTGSERTHRLPFNLYLRVGRGAWAPKHRSEFESLQLIKKHTRIPAPRAIDAVQYSDSSYLLMSGLPGRCIGSMLPTMTDRQVDDVVRDLKEYITELRQIPNKTGSEFQICNALGGGILDWRIGDSQRKELKFRSEAEFNHFLTHNLPLDKDALEKISKSHSVNHEIVFTHADLNMANILADENGKISGIVDWECAGWYPEYWEYSKAHFTVRYNARWIADVLDQVFPSYRDELEVEDMFASMVPPW